MYTIIPLQYLQSWFSCREINIGLYCQVKSTVAISFEIFYHFLCLPGIFVALVSRLSENKNSYGCMLFTRNLFVVNLLKHLRSCHFPGNWFDPSSCHASEASVEHLCAKTTLQTGYYFFTESLATKANIFRVIGIWCLLCKLLVWQIQNQFLFLVLLVYISTCPRILLM